VVEHALAVGRDVLPPYSHRFSPRKYTQPQLFACLVLKTFFKTDYRGLTALPAALNLPAVPHFTTLQKASRRLLRLPRARALFTATVRRFLGRRRRVRRAALDSTGLDCGHASRYYIRRRNGAQKRWQTVASSRYAKLEAAFDCASHLMLAALAGRGPRVLFSLFFALLFALLDGPPEERANPVHQVVALGVAPDGKTAVTWSMAPSSGDRAHDVWDLATGKALGHRPDASAVVTPPQFSPDARLALEPAYEDQAEGMAAPGGAGGRGAGGAAGRGPALAGVLLRDVVTGRETARVRPADGFAGLKALAPDGRTLVTATSRQGRTGDPSGFENTLRLWDLVSGKERLTIRCGTGGHFDQVAFAPDNRTLATALDDRTVQLWDVGTGKRLGQHVAPDTPAQCLAFAPDSRSLASGHPDGTILLWDLTGASREACPGGEADAGQLERWWADLAGDDARTAHAAVRGLGAAPGPAVRLFRDRLRPVAEGPPDKLRQRIAELDGPEFARRAAATRERTAFHEGAGPALRAALKASRSPEQRRRLEEILHSFEAVPPGEGLRPLRAVEALERIGADGARDLLEVLARGVPEARLTGRTQKRFPVDTFSCPWGRFARVGLKNGGSPVAGGGPSSVPRSG
jgi:hypothetical protein